MIVHRFMSEAEYQSLVKGKMLYNNTNHCKSKGQRSSSVGFCFFIENPDEAVHRLSGIVDLDWCVTMEVDEGFLIQSYGWYVDEGKWDKSRVLRLGDSVPAIRRREYCRCRYSLVDVQILGATQKYKAMFPSKVKMKEVMKTFVKRGYL